MMLTIDLHETGRSRGFGFVSFESTEQAQAAIDGMNEQDLDGRTVRVNMANERPAGGNRGGFGGCKQSPPYFLIQTLLGFLLPTINHSTFFSV